MKGLFWRVFLYDGSKVVIIRNKLRGDKY